MEKVAHLQSDLLVILSMSGKFNGSGIMSAVTGLSGWNKKASVQGDQ